MELSHIKEIVLFLKEHGITTFETQGVKIVFRGSDQYKSEPVSPPTISQQSSTPSHPPLKEIKKEDTNRLKANLKTLKPKTKQTIKGVILEELRDGKPHKLSEVKKNLINAGYGMASINVKVTQMKKDGTIINTGRGEYMIAKEVVKPINKPSDDILPVGNQPIKMPSGVVTDWSEKNFPRGKGHTDFI